ncbi:MAG: hypothetical protein JNG52_09110 [Muribaculaceae bacterium]|jgi:phosphate-selective porin OprO/OprP|uniref:hypothetical protein n=1 Tax=Candidatus Limisoma sp. TaxID=3076476 RepID=UPI001A3C2F02|nr:hypothetical protein [Muribaculaceae bacterium]
MRNKKYIFMSALAVMALSATAQDFDNTPTLNINNKEKQVKFTVGARFMADAAYYNTEATPLKSGATISDARIRTSMSYGENWYFYADFGFGGGKFSQKNIFLQYANKADKGTHAVKVGYYNDPAGTMAAQTSLGSYHFISRPGMASSIGEGRELGITYKFSNDHFFAYQGVFTESAYNRLDAGYNGLTLSGRWLYRNASDVNSAFHVGVSARYAKLGGGEEVTTKGSTVLKKSLSLGQSLETYVDQNNIFCSATLPWANEVIDFGAEALLVQPDFFVRAEYKHKVVTKHRDSYSIFIASQDNIDGWGDPALWEQANKIKTNHFNGAYVELGYKFFGNAYSYDKFNGVMNGLSGKSLEIVGRFNYTGLNDLTEGEYYSAGRDQYYAAGFLQDFPGIGATSVGGGDIYSTTIGLNYAFNKYAQVMLDYTWHRVNIDRLPHDKNVHAVQARVQFTF